MIELENAYHGSWPGDTPRKPVSHTAAIDSSLPTNCQSSPRPRIGRSEFQWSTCGSPLVERQ